MEKGWKGVDKMEKYIAEGASKEEAAKRVREESVNKRSHDRDDKESKKSKKEEKKSKDKDKESHKDSQDHHKHKEHKSDHKSPHRSSSQADRDLEVEPAQVPAKQRTLGRKR